MFKPDKDRVAQEKERLISKHEEQAQEIIGLISKELKKGKIVKKAKPAKSIKQIKYFKPRKVIDFAKYSYENNNQTDRTSEGYASDPYYNAEMSFKPNIKQSKFVSSIYLKQQRDKKKSEKDVSKLYDQMTSINQDSQHSPTPFDQKLKLNNSELFHKFKGSPSFEVRAKQKFVERMRSSRLLQSQQGSRL